MVLYMIQNPLVLSYSYMQEPHDFAGETVIIPSVNSPASVFNLTESSDQAMKTKFLLGVLLIGLAIVTPALSKRTSKFVFKKTIAFYLRSAQPNLNQMVLTFVNHMHLASMFQISFIYTYVYYMELTLIYKSLLQTVYYMSLTFDRIMSQMPGRR